MRARSLNRRRSAPILTDTPPGSLCGTLPGDGLTLAAQKLLFAHTASGNLLPYLAGHFDTTTGSKVEPGSYDVIARTVGLPPARLLFVTDNVKGRPGCVEACAAAWSAGANGHAASTGMREGRHGGAATLGRGCCC